MTKPYEKRLEAIREMLTNPSPELVEEGYGLLFKLWLQNADNHSFVQDLIPVALEHKASIEELERRLSELSLSDTITDTFLKKHLTKFALEVEKSKVERSKAAIPLKEPLRVDTIELEEPQTRFAWWQLLLLAIALTSIWLLINVEYSYQMIVVLIVAVCGIITLPYILPRKDRSISVDLVGIKLNYNFPTYLSFGDENIVHISVENSSETEFTGKITLVFKDPDSLVTPAANESLSATVDVPPLGREAKQFKFLILKKPSDRNLNYYFQISTGDSKFLSNEENFLIAPIPYLRSTVAWLFGSAGLGALIVALLWEQLKVLLGF